MVQTVRPASDISTGSWADEGTSFNDGNLYTSIQEVTSDNEVSYIIDTGANTTCEVKLDAGTDPADNTNHVLHVLYRATGTGGPERVTVQLRQGSSTLIHDSGNLTNRSGSFLDYNYTLLETEEASLITDYSDLRIRITASNLGGSETMRVTQAYLEYPDEGAVVLTGVLDGLHAHAPDAIALTQAHTLNGVLDGLHSHLSDPIATTKNSALTGVLDGLHTHLSDDPDLTAILPTQEGWHIILQPVGRRMATRFVPKLFGGEGDAPTVLEVQDGLHSHTSDSPVLTQAHVLAVQDGLHSHLSDSPALTYNVNLVTQDGLHTHASDAIALTQAQVLTGVLDGLHAHTSDDFAITQAHVLIPADGIHAHLVDSPVLTQAHVLVAQDGLHSHASDAVSVFSFPWNDGFESGDTSAWDSEFGTLTINGAAALVGSYGFEMAWDDANTYVSKDWTNTTHQIYRVKFKIDINDLDDTADNGSMDFSQILDGATWVGYTLLNGGIDGGINIRAVIRRNDSSTAEFEELLTGEHEIEIEWDFAAGDMRWWIDGAEKTGATGVTSDNWYPDSYDFGDAYGASFDSGSAYLDDFTIYNTVRPDNSLTVQDGAHSHISDPIALTQDHTLSVQDGAHTHISENPVLVQTVDLVPSDGSHTHISENPVLSQVHNLIPQDGLHAHDGEVPDLAKTVYLVSQDGLHTHVSESPALTQFNVLSTQDGLHSHTSDSPSLTQTHVLVTLDGLHAHTGELLNLSGTTSLSVQDGLHTHISDAFALTQYHNLTSQDGLHAHTGEVPSLDVTHHLVSQDGAHTHISDDFAITQTHNLISQDGVHAHVADAPSLSVTHVLITDDGDHTHISEVPDLTRIEWFVPTNIIPRRSRQIPIRQLRL